MRNLRAYIFAWNPWTRANAAAHRAALESLGVPCRVIDAADSYPSSAPTAVGPEWHAIGRDAHWAAQWAALRRLLAESDDESDVVLNLCGDACVPDWPSLLRHAADAGDRPGWGCYAPRVDWCGWEWDAGEPSEVPGVRHVRCTDSVLWFVRRDVVDLMPSFDSGRYRLGWGPDWLACEIARRTGRPAVRDERVTVYHPRATGYDRDEATAQFAAFRAEYGPWLEMRWPSR